MVNAADIAARISIQARAAGVSPKQLLLDESLDIQRQYMLAMVILLDGVEDENSTGRRSMG